MKDHGQKCNGYPCTCSPVTITKRPVDGVDRVMSAARSASARRRQYRVEPLDPIPSTIPAQRAKRKQENEFYRDGFLMGGLLGFTTGAIATIIFFANAIRWEWFQ